MKDGFIKFAAGVPDLRVADPAFNAQEILRVIAEAEACGASVLVLPELCVTGATCGDIFCQEALLSGAEVALERIAEATSESTMLIFLGLPVRRYASIYNCAVALQSGRILGITPKACLYGENDRCFTAAPLTNAVISLAGQETVFGPDIVYCHEQIPELRIVAEIGADLLLPEAPGFAACRDAGATVVVNCAALPDQIGARARRGSLLKVMTERYLCGYVLAGAGVGESTTDEVYSGHSLICENGLLLAERAPYSDVHLVFSEIDVRALVSRRMTEGGFETVESKREEVWFDAPLHTCELTRPVSRDPFLCEHLVDNAEACREILEIQANGLRRRLTHTHAKCAVIGISGGLDSTLALLATAEAYDLMGRPRNEIIAVTMPCFGTTARTRGNADKLCEKLGVDLRCIPIGDAVLQHFSDIGQDPKKTDVTFENSQARERTQILMDLSNREGGIVIGTGDLSELALGFATYNGDHMSMYGVNASVPKTLIRHIVAVYADACADAELAAVLHDILDTPVSPELLPADDGVIAQKTEEILGDYILQDFFLYHALRYGHSPAKVLRLAEYAFNGEYSRAYIKEKLTVFYRRFFTQQFKRSCLPDGPATGEISLSPRGSFHMPSDASAALWLSEVETL